ncbi:MAG: ABC transporter ATP-binding protein [Acidimicrobiia bacterium]|nr:ABC transporter ATP-binding protein [Acidimicrobiia bacterium]
MTAVITVEEVSKRFRLYHERNQSLKIWMMRGRRAAFEEFWALRDVSLEIEQGKTFGLIGENGSGKSTLLKCIAKILRPDSGRIGVTGKVSALLELGAGFHPELSGRENVYLNGSILGLGKRELDRIFDDIVGFAGLERFIDTPVKNYSSGMYIRLGFSVAINVDPDILLIDEILAVGDEQFQRKCNEKFADFKNEGKTVVIVSHSLGSVRNMCDRVALLDHGRVKELGPASEVVDAYLGGVHTDRQAVEEEEEATTGTRWGSGEVVVERIELLGSTGMPATWVKTGDQVTVRLHYAARAQVAKPVFKVVVSRADGMEISGPNTRDAGMVPESISEEGYVDLVIDNFPLLPGTYDITSSVQDYSCLHDYDVRHRALRFDVEQGEPRESTGFVTLGGRWQMARMDAPR